MKSKLFAILLGSLSLFGCTGLESQPSPSKPTVSQTAAPVVVKESVEIPVLPPTIESTDTLIQHLDAAGCDFSSIAATDGVTRKGSSTLLIACK